jgi:hypothetical protein
MRWLPLTALVVLASCSTVWDSCASMDACMPMQAGARPTCTATPCWENPVSQGNDYYGAWENNAKDVWLVGDKGTILNRNYDPRLRTYRNPRREMSRGRPRSPTGVIGSSSAAV